MRNLKEINKKRQTDSKNIWRPSPGKNWNKTYGYQNLEERLAVEFERAKRYDRPLSLVVIDLDNVELVQNTRGDQFAEFIFEECMKLFKQSTRKVDIVCKDAGERLVVILPETDREKSVVPAERIRHIIEVHKFELGDQSLQTTVSIGISSFPEDASSEDDLIAHAVFALCEAKQRGGNCVVQCR